MLLPIIRDKSHDPFIIFGGLFSRDLIFDLLQTCKPTSDSLNRIASYCENIKRHCPNEDYLRNKIAEHLIDGSKSLPKNSQGDIFFEDAVVEVKHKLNELNLDSISGSLNVASGRRKETAEEELFRYLEKHRDNVTWGVLTSGRIFRFYNSAAQTCYLEFDLFDIVASGALAHAHLFLTILNDQQKRDELFKNTERIRSVQSEQMLLARVRVFYSKAKGDRVDLTKGCLFLLMVRYLEDIGVLPINSLEYRKSSLGIQENLSPSNLNKILDEFVQGRWFNGLEQNALSSEDVKVIRSVICDERNQKAILGLLFDERGKPLSLADIYIDHLGNIYQTHIHEHAEGAYYTPYSIGKKLSEYLLSLNQTSRMKFAQNPNKVIIDPACGSGQLLRALIPFAHNFYDHSGEYKPKNSVRRDFISRLVGIDKDEESAFICKVGLGLMGAEEGLGLAESRLVKKENTLDAFLDSRRNFSEIAREDIFAIVTNPPWESLEFNLTQLYRNATGKGLPKKASVNKATGAKKKELDQAFKDFDDWCSKNQALINKEKARLDELIDICDRIAVDNPTYFKGKKNLALYFLYIINRLMEDSTGAYIAVLPDRFFVGEDCPLRDKLFAEIEAYMPFQGCGRIFEGVDNGTRFGVIFGRKGSNKDFIFADIPVIENAVPIDFISRKMLKADLKVGEIEVTDRGSTDKRTLPFFKTAEDIDLLTNWTMHRSPVKLWEQGRINLGNRNGPGEEYGSLGAEGKFKYRIVKSSSKKSSDNEKLKGVLNLQFGASVEKIPSRLQEHFKSSKIITSNVKSNGVRKVAVALGENCIVEHAYNFNTGLNVSDLWWLQSLTFNHLVNNLSGSYNINTGLLDFLGCLKTKKKVPLHFVDREVHLLREIGFSDQESISIIATILLSDFPEAFIKETYKYLESKFAEQFKNVSGENLLIQYQPALAVRDQTKSDRHSKEIVANRVAVSAFIVDNLKNDPHFGRVKLEKCLYMLEATGAVNLYGEYARKAAGPLDVEALYNRRFGIENVAAQLKVFESKMVQTGRIKRVIYNPGIKFNSAVQSAEKVFGSNISKAQKLLKIMKKATTEQAEIIATVFAAWNDLIQAGVNPTPDVIVNEVRQNWAETKTRFTPARLKIALNWLKEMKLVPIGEGPRTLE